MKYVALLRGINVGGKNKISMAELKMCFETYQHVSTYINSGNVLFASAKSAETLAREIEAALVTQFTFDSDIIKTLVISEEQLKQVITSAPDGFGSEPAQYHSDVIFLLGIAPSQAIQIFEPREGVDTIWQGKQVIYSQRLSSQLTKSRLGKIAGKPEYKQLTIRNWNTVTKLYQRMQDMV